MGFLIGVETADLRAGQPQWAFPEGPCPFGLKWINPYLAPRASNEPMHRDSLLFAASIGWLAFLAVAAFYVLMH